MNRTWLLGLAAIIVITAGGIAALALRSGDDGLIPSFPNIFGDEDEDEVLPQAPWRFETYPAASGKKPKRRVIARVTSQRAELRRLVQRVYFALFLDPDAKKRAARTYFTNRAARAFLASRAGLPAGADRTRTMSRRAEISVDGPTAQRAAAKIKVVARTTVGDERVRLRHRATLFLERAGPRWRVIAFEVTQRRIR